MGYYIVWRNGNEVRVFDRLSQVRKFKQRFSDSVYEIYFYRNNKKMKLIRS
jgi:hypothetical protein